MAKGLVNESSLNSIAEAINVLNGSEGTYLPSEMGAAIIDAIPTEEVTDNIVSVTDAAAYPAEGLEFSVEPVQDLHGYDKPWPAGGGKNLLPITAENQTTNGVTFTVNKDSAGNVVGITANGTATANAIFYLNANFEITDNSAYIFSGCPVNGSFSSFRMECYYRRAESAELVATATDIGNGVTLDITDKEGAARINRFIAVVMDGYTANNLVFKPMIRLASDTDPTFEPYANICPISGWTEVNGERTGKNLYSGETSRHGYYSNNGSFVPSSSYSCSNIISIKPDINYTFVIESTYSSGGYVIQTVWFDLQKNFISVSEKALGGAGTKVLNLNNIPTNAKYVILVCIRDSNSRGFYIGSVPESYEPYQGTSIPITFPTEAGTVYGGKVDVVNGKLTVDRAEVDLGGLNWTQESNHFYSEFINDALAPISNYVEFSGLSDIYKTTTQYAVAQESNNCTIAMSNSKRLYVYDDRYSDTATFTAAVTGSKLVYELATPIEYDITPQQVQMLLGDNNVWCDTGDTTLEYKVDLSRYIAKLQAQATPQLSLSRQAVSLEEPRDAEVRADKDVILEVEK